MDINCVIIDDESNIRELISNIITDSFANINIVGIGNSVLTGLKEIEEKKPELIFLDIELPDGTGFDILESIQEDNYKVIFISAFNEYAIKAFKYSAVDYILKPINILGFIKAVNKSINSIVQTHNYKVLLENIKSDYPSKLIISTNEGLEYINIDDIVFINGDGRYSTINFVGGKKSLESKTLSYFEDILNSQFFLRIHKSYIINLKHVKSFKKVEGGQVCMSDGSLLNISRNKKEIFLEKMEQV